MCRTLSFKESQMPLPIVNEEILFSIQHELENPEGDFLQRMLTHLFKKNLCVAAFIKNLCDFYENKGHDPGVLATCMLLTYKLLETQSEVDDLESQRSP